MHNAVYFLRAGDAVKIGHTKNVEHRIKKLQIGNHCELELLLTIPMSDSITAHLLEKKIHKCFKVYHIRHEWFKYSALLGNVIEGIKINGVQTTLTALIVSSRFFIGDSECITR